MEAVLYRTTVYTTRGTTRVANEVTCAFGISIFFPGRNPVTPISRRFLVGRLVSKLLVVSVGIITARGATSSTVNPSGKFGT